MPNKFIPTAEESKLIISITEYVTYEAMKAYKSIKKLTEKDYKIAINFSSRDFISRELLEKFKTYSQKTNVPAQTFILELTERMLLNYDSPESLIQKFKKLGCAIAIDDFGTGYSNLMALSNINSEYIKIDKSLINKIGTDHVSSKLVKAAITLANTLGEKTIAEGVETQQQLDFLRDNGCDMAQGYFIHMPQSLADIKKLIATEK